MAVGHWILFVNVRVKLFLYQLNAVRNTFSAPALSCYPLLILSPPTTWVPLLFHLNLNDDGNWILTLVTSV